MKAVVASGISGAIFAAGLGLSGMIYPAKIIGFLDFFGQWDPSLLWVMVGAIGVHLPLRIWIQRKSRPQFAAAFSVTAAGRMDSRLFAGAALFGIGWGLSGYCPGPAIVSATMTWPALATLAAMLLGIALYEWFPVSLPRRGFRLESCR
jgi:uncharacterized membrane protein YedE/YeeE